ncbi:hypothetical protein LTR97_011055 [Elasticomyces elasticus]|uniref:DUF6590 domain-containing protein n=1 Tax=Elasticomyces elasticus TaxID=574655 RepID=A0AAN7ZVZ6_9PEZI|nr:hypothetical protein LTR97_011055 [Elasticomyces elasticus]
MIPTTDYAALVLSCSEDGIALFRAVERLAAPNSKHSWLYSVASIYEACEAWSKSVDFADMSTIKDTKQRAALQTLERLSQSLKRAIDECAAMSGGKGLLSRSNDSKDEIDSDSSIGAESDWPTSVLMPPGLAIHWRRMLADSQILRQQPHWLPRVPFQPISKPLGSWDMPLDADDVEQMNADETIVRLYVAFTRGSDARSVNAADSSDLGRIQDAALSARLVRGLRFRRMMIRDAAKRSKPGAYITNAVATKEMVRQLATNPKASLNLPSNFAAGLSGKCYFCDKTNASWKRGDESYRHHLLRHLRLYSCTYASCTSPDELYDSLDSWTRHEEHVEQLKWVCPYSNGKDYAATFSERDGFKSHLKEKHQELTDDEVQYLLNYARQVRPVQPTHCGLCRKSSTSVDGSLRTHLHGHFQQLGMLSFYDCGPDIIKEHKQATSSSNQYSTLTQLAPGRRIRELEAELISQSSGYARRNKSFFVPGRIIQIRKYRDIQTKYDSAYGSAPDHAIDVSGSKEGGNGPDDGSDKWFLIIKTDADASHCLLITTNNGRGVSRSDSKSNYSPVCSASQEAQILDEEQPTTPREAPMQDKIHVTPTGSSHPLPALARILWTQTHEIPHDCEAQLCAIVSPRTEYLIIDIYKEMMPGRGDLDIPKRQ